VAPLDRDSALDQRRHQDARRLRRVRRGGRARAARAALLRPGARAQALREWIEHEAQRPRAPAPARVGVPAPAPAARARTPSPARSPRASPDARRRRWSRRRSRGFAACRSPALSPSPAGRGPSWRREASALRRDTINEPGGRDEAPPPASAPQAPRLVAERVAGQEPGSAHDVGEGLVIGRAKGVSIRLSDPLVSGRHARVAPDGERRGARGSRLDQRDVPERRLS
jgi:hypothetical protein